MTATRNNQPLKLKLFVTAIDAKGVETTSVRRFRAPAEILFKPLCDLIRLQVLHQPDGAVAAMAVAYEDADGDTVAVTGDLELAEALAQHRDRVATEPGYKFRSGAVPLNISLPRGSVLLPSPATAESNKCAAATSSSDSDEDDEIRREAMRIAFSQVILRVIDNSSDSDGDSGTPRAAPAGDNVAVAVITQHILHNKSIKLFKNKKFVEAKALLAETLKRFPENAVARYNLACAMSLIGEPLAAVVAQLSAAVDAGYTNFKLMLRDPDLVRVRESPEMVKLLEEHFGRALVSVLSVCPQVPVAEARRALTSHGNNIHAAVNHLLITACS